MTDVGARGNRRELRRVIVASSLGTLFEWYDFYLYGSLAVFFGELFFPPGNERAALLASLATFGAGLRRAAARRARVRPHRRPRSAASTPSSSPCVTMGLVDRAHRLPADLRDASGIARARSCSCRCASSQGLALGGEYGGAATYVAEHVPDERRGYYTSFIQTTATLGFFVSLGGDRRLPRSCFGAEAFQAFGWRVPFLASFVLLGGLALHPAARCASRRSSRGSRREGTRLEEPAQGELRQPDATCSYVLLALFGATAGQGVVWYTGQFYALTFLQKPLNLDWQLAYALVAVALALGTPFFVVFGALSDRIGRKRIMLAGCAARRADLRADLHGDRRRSPTRRWRRAVTVAAAGAAASGSSALLFVQMLYVTMVYGPIAAFLVELFPTSIRYTSMSLPYHLGNGWFGGFLPLIATAVTTSAWAQRHLRRRRDLHRAHLSDRGLRDDAWSSAASSSARRRTTRSTRRSAEALKSGGALKRADGN